MARGIHLNTKDITAAASNILLVGDSGTHKTFFLGGVPGIHIFDFDKGATILKTAGLSVEYDVFKDAPKNWKLSDMERKVGIYDWGTAWPAFIKRLNDIGELIDKGKGPKAIGLDSLTMMSEMAMCEVLKNGKTTEAGGPTIASYGAQINYMKTVLGQLTAWPIQLIATAHIQRDNNDLTQNVEKLPLLTGKLAGLISIYFDEVYFCESDKDAAGKQKFTLITQATPSIRQAKSRWGVPNGTETSWAAVSKHFKFPSAVFS